MNAILWPFFSFVAKNRWAQIVLGLGVFWLIFMLWLAMHDSGIRRVQREKAKARELEEQKRLDETVTQIGQETEDAKARALDAPSHVDDVGSVGELRERYPANAEVILRQGSTGDRQGPR